MCICMRPSHILRPRLPDCCQQHPNVTGGLPSRSPRWLGGKYSANSRQLSTRLCCSATAAREQSSTPSVSQAAPQGTAESRYAQPGAHSQGSLDCRHFEQCSGCTVAEAAAVAEPPIVARAREFFRGVDALRGFLSTHHSEFFADQTQHHGSPGPSAMVSCRVRARSLCNAATSPRHLPVSQWHDCGRSRPSKLHHPPRRFARLAVPRAAGGARPAGTTDHRPVPCGNP